MKYNNSETSYLLIGPFATTVFLTPYLRYQGISLFSDGAIKTYLIFIIVGLLLGVVLYKSLDSIRAILLSAIILLFIVYQLEELPSLPFDLKYRYVLPIFALCLAACLYLIKDELGKVFLLCLCILWGGSFFIFSAGDVKLERNNQENNMLPPIIHIILDEHIGIDGIPVTDKEVEYLKYQIIQIYNSRGFKIYERAFSRYDDTGASLSNAFNYAKSTDRDKYLVDASKKNKKLIEPNALFNDLYDEGYTLNVLESSELSFCSDIEGNSYIYRCKEYLYDKLLNSKPIVLLAGLAYKTRISVLLNIVLEQSGLPKIINPYTSSASTLAAINNNRDFITEAKNGHYYLIHLLLPHGPFSLNESCELTNKSIERSDNSINYLDKYKSYMQQVMCITNVMSEIIDEIESANDKSKIYIHGDHGSRIQKNINLANNDINNIQLFSTLFVEKLNVESVGNKFSPIALEQLFKRISNINNDSGFTDNSILKKDYINDNNENKWEILKPFKNGVPVLAW